MLLDYQQIIKFPNMHLNSDTQTEAASENPRKQQQQQRTQKKKNRKRKISLNEQTPNKKNSIRQSKVKATQLQQQRDQKQYVKIKVEKITNEKVKQIQKLRQNEKLSNNCIIHSSVLQKFALSFVLSIISIALFTQAPPIDYPLAHFQQGTHEPVFQILTDRKTRYITFNIEKSQDLLLGIKSTKSAKIKAGVKYNLGYKFKSKNFDSSALPGKNSQIEMSELMILQYSIQNVSLADRSDGYFNTWDFEDHQSLVNFVKEKYIKSMEEETLASITDERRKMYENKAKFMLTQMIDRSQSWFDWLLKRVDTYLDGGLQPYVKNIQILYSKTSQQRD